MCTVRLRGVIEPLVAVSVTLYSDAGDCWGLPHGVPVVVETVRVEDTVPSACGWTVVGLTDNVGQFDPGHVPASPPETEPTARLTELEKLPKLLIFSVPKLL